MQVMKRPIAELMFSQRETVALTQPDAATLDNWLRYGHVQPALNEAGKRVFSVADLVKIEVLHMLAFLFEMKPSVGRPIADAAVAEWLPFADTDLSTINRPETARQHFQFDGYRELTEAGSRGDLREARDGDNVGQIVTVLLPVHTLARELLKRISARAGTSA